MTSQLVSIFKAKLETYEQRLITALAGINIEQLWWKPNQNSLSIGIILQHLNGNIGQWIVSGFSQQADTRNRKDEFKGNYQTEVTELLQVLHNTLKKAMDAIDSQNENDWQQSITVQGFTLKKIEILFDVVEHFSWHTGQVVYIVKLLKGPEHGIAFYNDAKLNTAHNRK